MSRYFINLYECGNVTTDDEGIQRDDMAAILKEALLSAREVMCAELAEGRLCLSCHIEVKDDAGAVVLTVPFRDAVTITGI